MVKQINIFSHVRLSVDKMLNSDCQSTVVNAITSSTISVTPINPKCLPCPLGATCSYPFYFADPGYWGYVRTDGRIQMVKCTEEYCCSGKENCQTIQSCNHEREGTLCARCVDNKTESFFSPRCLSANDCHGGVFLALYFLSAFGYVMFLLIFNDMKSLLSEKTKLAILFLKKRFEYLTNRPRGIKSDRQMQLHEMSSGFRDRKVSLLVDSLLLCDHSFRNENFQNDPTHDWTVYQNQRSASAILLVNNYAEPKDKVKVKVSKSCQTMDIDQYAKGKENNDISMKFIQMLFYYVQDASLFKVHIPTEDSETKSWFVYLLRFSPKIMSTLSSMTEICSVWIHIPVLKILFHSLFGMCSLLFLSMIYLGQWFLSRLTFYGCSQVFSSMKVRLCQTFIVVFLLSYQKLEQVKAARIPSCVVYFTRNMGN